MNMDREPRAFRGSRPAASVVAMRVRKRQAGLPARIRGCHYDGSRSATPQPFSIVTDGLSIAQRSPPEAIGAAGWGTADAADTASTIFLRRINRQ
jgi:hypothetical protein